MSHHGDNPFEEPERRTLLTNELRRKLFDSTNLVGATGQWPLGKLNDDDEGGLRLALKAENGTVVIDFGTSVTWVGMTPQEAADFASAILKMARGVARTKGETVGFTVM